MPAKPDTADQSDDISALLALRLPSGGLTQDARPLFGSLAVAAQRHHWENTQTRRYYVARVLKTCSANGKPTGSWAGSGHGARKFQSQNATTALFTGEPMMKKNTYAQAYEACETFFAETGIMPTIEAIKPIIGVNSPSIISSAIKDWKSVLSQAVRKGQGIDPGVPKGLLDAVSELWEQALGEAKNTIKDKVEEVQAKQTELKAKEAGLAAETAHIQQLVHVTEQKFQEEIIYLKKEIGRLAAECLVSAEQTEHFRTVATQVEKKNAVLTEEIRQGKEKFQRLENQYDKEHDWALKRIEQEKDSHRQQTQNEMNRLQCETTRNKQTVELLQAKVDLMEKQANENRGKIIGLER